MAPWLDAPTPHRPCQRVRRGRDRVPRDRSGRPGGPRPLSPSVNLKGTTIQRSLFGMHVFNLEDGVFPTVPDRRRSGCGTTRRPGRPSRPAQDQFNWAKLDARGRPPPGPTASPTSSWCWPGTPAWATDDPASGGAAGVLPGRGRHAEEPRRLGRLGPPGGHPLQGQDHGLPALERGQPRHLLHRHARRRWRS